MEFNFENRIFRVIAFFIWVLFIGYFWVHDCNRFKPENQYKNARYSIMTNVFSGIVIEKYRDEWNHNNAMIKFKRGKDIGIEDIFWNQIKIRDSIVKRKGELFIEVYRDKKMFKLSYQPILDYYLE